jgi:hypothetical protein
VKNRVYTLFWFFFSNIKKSEGHFYSLIQENAGALKAFHLSPDPNPSVSNHKWEIKYKISVYAWVESEKAIYIISEALILLFKFWLRFTVFGGLQELGNNEFL